MFFRWKAEHVSKIEWLSRGMVTDQAPRITALAERATRAPLQKGGAMLCPVLLWIDLTECGRHGELSTLNRRQCLIYRVSGAQGLGERIGSVQPHALCFEFDYPNPSGLTLLKETKQRHPALPIVMLAEPHTETLAVWALRARVWNYFVKPVAPPEIVRSLMPLFKAPTAPGGHRRRPRPVINPDHTLPQAPASCRLSRCDQAILKARRYAESHLEDQLSERMLARYCGLSAAYFSRTFKRITGLSFRAFLPQARVKRAMSLKGLCRYSKASPSP